MHVDISAGASHVLSRTYWLNSPNTPWYRMESFGDLDGRAA